MIYITIREDITEAAGYASSFLRETTKHHADPPCREFNRERSEVGNTRQSARDELSRIPLMLSQANSVQEIDLMHYILDNCHGFQRNHIYIAKLATEF